MQEGRVATPPYSWLLSAGFAVLIVCAVDSGLRRNDGGRRGMTGVRGNDGV